MNDKYLRRAYSHLQINDDYASWLEETAGNDDAMMKLYRDLNVTARIRCLERRHLRRGSCKKKDPSPSLDGESPSPKKDGSKYVGYGLPSKPTQDYLSRLRRCRR